MKYNPALWVVEILIGPNWHPTKMLIGPNWRPTVSIKLSRQEGRAVLSEWRTMDPNGKFRLVKYVREAT